MQPGSIRILIDDVFPVSTCGLVTVTLRCKLTANVGARWQAKEQRDDVLAHPSWQVRVPLCLDRSAIPALSLPRCVRKMDAPRQRFCTRQMTSVNVIIVVWFPNMETNCNLNSDSDGTRAYTRVARSFTPSALMRSSTSRRVGEQEKLLRGAFKVFTG